MASGVAVTSPPSASSSKRSIRCARRSPAGDAVTLRFEDHAGFERTCLVAATGGALAAFYATSTTPPADLVPRAAAGAVFALVVAVRWEELPPVPCIAAAAALAAGAVYAAPSLLALTEILEIVLPRSGAAALGGAALGLWLGGATIPLH